MQTLPRWHLLCFLAFLLSVSENHRTTVNAFDTFAKQVKHGAGPQDTQSVQADASAMAIVQQVVIVFCV